MAENIAALKADLEEAEAAFESLVSERRANRESMTKTQFRAYNEETRSDQKAAAQAVADALEAITVALNNSRQELFVGTISEKNTAGEVNG